MNNAKSQIQSQLLKMLKTQDIYAIKVKTLTDSLHISRSTFYLYYDSVYSVLQDMEDTFFDKLQSITALFWQYPLDRKYMREPHPIMLQTLEFLDTHRELSFVLWGPHGDPIFQTRCKKMIQNNFFPDQIARSLYPDNTWLTVAYKVGGHLETLSYWWYKEKTISTREMATKSYHLLFGDVLKYLK